MSRVTVDALDPFPGSKDEPAFFIFGEFLPTPNLRAARS